MSKHATHQLGRGSRQIGSDVNEFCNPRAEDEGFEPSIAVV